MPPMVFPEEAEEEGVVVEEEELLLDPRVGEATTPAAALPLLCADELEAARLGPPNFSDLGMEAPLAKAITRRPREASSCAAER